MPKLLNIAATTVASFAMTSGLFVFADPANANHADVTVTRRPASAGHLAVASAVANKTVVLRISEAARQDMAVLR